MLVPLPIGMWVLSFACDLAFVFGSGDPTWSTVARYAMAGGIIGALAAAIFGFIDVMSLPAQIRKTGLASAARWCTSCASPSPTEQVKAMSTSLVMKCGIARGVLSTSD